MKDKITEPVILVMDDDATILRQLKQLLNYKGYQKVFTATGPADARRVFETQKTDIFISDILLAKNQNGIDLVKELREEYFFLLIFISACQEEMVTRALPVRPEAYLVKPFSNVQFITTLKTTWANHLASADNDSVSRFNLSSREIDIIRFVCSGKSSREIGDILCLSRYTIQNHRARILEKMGVQNAQELISKAHQCGIA